MSDQQIKFELERLVDRSDDAILSEIRRVASLVGEPHLSAVTFARHAKVSRNTVSRRFGTWENALTLAGLADRIHPQNRPLTDEEILEGIRRLASELGQTEITFRIVAERLGVSFARLKKGWGSSGAAFKAAGLSVVAGGQRYTDEDCFENLLNVWTALGRAPRIKEMNVPPSRVGGKAYIRRFGTWNRALHAFVERINGESSEGELLAEPMIKSAPTNEQQKHLIKDERGPRDAPLGLRFKVLTRDQFRCTLCGDNPPRNPECVLHVDHILPWSKGGSTVLENLRTLCAKCNLGRSNKYLA